MILTFFGISHNYFCIGKVMDWVYGSRNHDWLFVHGGLATMGRRGRSGSQEFVVIAWKERERRLFRLSPMAPLGDDHTTTLNRGGRWCSDGEMVLGAWRRLEPG
jgi:hypothetical protein